MFRIMPHNAPQNYIVDYVHSITITYLNRHKNLHGAPIPSQENFPDKQDTLPLVTKKQVMM